MVPAGHLQFAKDILAQQGVPELPEGETAQGTLLGWTAATATPQVDVALNHPKMRLIANALGTPPDDIIAEIKEGRLVAALCGSPYQALKHKDAGIDIIIAQGGEGGGHTGEVGSLVLWPQVVAAVAPTPVLAAGGVGTGEQIAAALALGCAGVWSGTLWLTVEEADLPPAQKQSLLDAIGQRHGPVAVVHRQAVPHAAQRVDRGVGATRHADPLPDAAAVHGVGRVRRRAAPATPTRPSPWPSTRAARWWASSTTSARPTTSCRSWSRATSAPSIA